jgi:Protein of unknown function (DUF2934)
MAEATPKTPRRRASSTQQSATPRKGAVTKTEDQAAGVAPKKAAATRKRGTGPVHPTNGASALTPEERWRMVSEAAYFLAAERGFVGGDPLEDWVKAEAQIQALLGENKA